ncbi:MAG: hypothetical protein GTO22_25980 [Gemmatimonadales bacterium]|nr:hypothetical protein [Gemmatimonadales bacterium]
MIDAHCHPSGVRELTGVNVNLRTVAEVKEALRRRAAETPPGYWVSGYMYDDTKLDRPVIRRDLDEAAVPGDLTSGRRWVVFKYSVDYLTSLWHLLVADSRTLSTSSFPASGRQPPVHAASSCWTCSLRVPAQSRRSPSRPARASRTPRSTYRSCAPLGWLRPRRMVCTSPTAWPVPRCASSCGRCAGWPSCAWPR